MKNAKKLFRILIILLALAVAAAFGLSAYITRSVSDDIAGIDRGSGVDAAALETCRAAEPQCILVLGCGVWPGNRPSPMLRDRLDTAIALYRAGAAPKLLFSGDNSVPEYSEPDCMLAYALEQGVPEEDIFLDFAGFSTYDSVYRAKAVFCAENVIVVTQRYHLYRALQLCRALGLRAKGVGSDQRIYGGAYARELREVLARDKDLFKGLWKPDPTYLGDKIPVGGDGTVTHVN